MMTISTKAGHSERVHLAACACPETISELLVLHRQRRYAMQQAQRINNGTAALVRSSMGFRTVIPRDDYDTDKAHKAAKKSNDSLKKLALDFVRDVEKGLVIDGCHDEFAHCIPYILHASEARKPFDILRKTIEKRQAELVRSLAVWSWAEAIPGVAEGSIAAIIGECGDLSNYANPSKVWKRMGLAPYQGKSAATWKKKGGLSASDWIEIGDRSSGRTVMFNIGESIVKRPGTEYRLIYDERKAYEQDREADYAHGKAKRYMVKRLLRNLWREWRDCHGLAATSS